VPPPRIFLCTLPSGLPPQTTRLLRHRIWQQALAQAAWFTRPFSHRRSAQWRVLALLGSAVNPAAITIFENFII
jgi:hypothetical protein